MSNTRCNSTFVITIKAGTAHHTTFARGGIIQDGSSARCHIHIHNRTNSENSQQGGGKMQHCRVNVFYRVTTATQVLELITLYGGYGPPLISRHSPSSCRVPWEGLFMRNHRRRSGVFRTRAAFSTAVSIMLHISDQCANRPMFDV